MCGGKQAATNLKRHGCDTIGKLYTISCDLSRRPSSLRGKQRQCDAAINMKRPVGKLGRWLGDDDLADKIPSLLFRLMFAFKELRVGGRKSGVSIHSGVLVPFPLFSITLVCTRLNQYKVMLCRVRLFVFPGMVGVFCTTSYLYPKVL